MSPARSSKIRAGAVLLALVAICGCSKNAGSPAPFVFGGARGGAGYVDMSKVIAVHPLHAEVQALENQITALNSQTLVTAQQQTPAQRAVAERLQRELSDAQSAFEQELIRRRSYYQQREAQAVRTVQEAILAESPGSGASSLLGGVQQQFGSQIQELQTQAGKTLAEYRDTLIKQDTAHLKHVQELISRDVSAKIRAKQSQLSSAETTYQIQLAKQDQPTKLNLKAKLDNLTLTDAERAQIQSQLAQIDRREGALADQMKARDDTELKAFERQQRTQAAARFNAERSATENATRAKLAQRQTEMQTQFRQQVGSLGGQFQQQISAANKALERDPKLRARVEGIHGDFQGKYMADANRALSAYQETRKMLLAKYSAIAHYQFVDNQGIAAQIDRLAGQRRDLLAKIIDQIRVRVDAVARERGVAIVFASVRGAGNAVDLTEPVVDAVSALSSTTPSPAATASGG